MIILIISVWVVIISRLLVMVLNMCMVRFLILE